jgi:hypothetical protein
MGVTAKKPILLVLSLLCILAAAVLCLLCTGCESGTTGVLRPIDAQVEHSITNSVATALQVNKAVVPAPWSTIFAAGGGAGLTLLAAWQAMTHRKVAENKAAIAATKTNGKA